MFAPFAPFGGHYSCIRSITSFIHDQSMKFELTMCFLCVCFSSGILYDPTASGECPVFKLTLTFFYQDRGSFCALLHPRGCYDISAVLVCVPFFSIFNNV
jgi:hypothetical protein